MYMIYYIIYIYIYITVDQTKSSAIKYLVSRLLMRVINYANSGWNYRVDFLIRFRNRVPFLKMYSGQWPFCSCLRQMADNLKTATAFKTIAG